MKVSALRQVIEESGIRWTDPRLQKMVKSLKSLQTVSFQQQVQS